MFVYASVMRPVINERASAWRVATRPSRGTKYASATAYSASQPTNGTSTHASNLPITASIVTK
jgi:hypothetical protein